MSRIEISAELCKACELCISVCPKECIEQSDTLNRYGVYPMRMKAGAPCTACTLCATMCADTAIEVYRTVVEKPAAEKPKVPDVVGGGGNGDSPVIPAPHAEALSGETVPAPVEKEEVAL
jgi:2-oxoglutarate ferredoxin oxidoreductase subunit delta